MMINQVKIPQMWQRHLGIQIQVRLFLIMWTMKINSYFKVPKMGILKFQTEE